MVHLPSVEIQIISHCNLNCKSCDHFSPLAKPWNITVEDFENELINLSKICIVDELVLIGGEPFLHPQLKQLISLSRKYFQKSKIKIFTNGLLVEKQIKDLSQELKKYGVGLKITKYPLKYNYQKLRVILKILKVWYTFENDYATDDEWLKINLSRYKQEEYDCYARKYCGNIQMVDNKLYFCQICAYVKYFNSFYDENFFVDENDYFNLLTESEDDLQKKFDNFKKHRLSFCRFCGKPSKSTWEISKKDIKEWKD